MPRLDFTGTEAGADVFASTTGTMRYGSDKTGSFPFTVDDAGNVTCKSLTSSAASALTGNQVITGGNLDIATAGNGLQVKEGANAKQGTAALTAGAATVANTSVTANSRIFLTSQADGGTPGWLRVSARTAGTSFTITSSSNLDTSTVAYLITEPG